MREKILEILKHSSSHVSGEEMSKMLGISRAAIWKHINQLKNEGYDIESVTNLGYKILSCPDILTYIEIKPYLKSKFIGKTIIHLDSIDSTNLYAKKICQEYIEDGIVIIAEEQTNGRGRLGRSWMSPKGKGIWMSMILTPNILPTEAHKITVIAAASIYKALEEFNIKASIKWPNDILINNKKVCGILTEMNAELDKINYIVLGIGINVNQDIDDFTLEIKDIATSLKIESSNYIDRKKLVANVINHFEEMYIDFLHNGDIEKPIEIITKNSCLIGKYVEIKNPNLSFFAKVVAIDKEGFLVVEKDGKVEKIVSGEVSLNGYYRG